MHRMLKTGKWVCDSVDQEKMLSIYFWILPGSPGYPCAASSRCLADLKIKIFSILRLQPKIQMSVVYNECEKWGWNNE